MKPEKPDLRGADKAASFNQYFPQAAARQMKEMLTETALGDKILANIRKTDQALAAKGGFAAEHLQAESFNLDAILKDADVRARTDVMPGGPPRNDGASDINMINSQGETLKTHQVKYYADGEKSGKALRAYNPESKNLKYGEVDKGVVPPEQLEEARNALKRTQNREQNSRPVVAQDAAKIEAKLDDRLRHGEVESKPPTLDEARTSAGNSQENDKWRDKVINEYQDLSTWQQATKAAKTAAIASAVVAGTLNSVAYLKLVREGKISEKDAVLGIIQNTGLAALDAGVKAGAATAAVSTAIRHFPQLFGDTLFRQSMTTGAISGATICAVDLVQCLVLVAAGKMTLKELEERTGKNIFQTGAGVLGSSIGIVIGSPAGPVGAAIGAMLGGMITSIGMSLAIEMGIDKPYHSLVSETRNHAQHQAMVAESIANLRQAEARFATFSRALPAVENQFRLTLDETAKQQSSLKQKLNKM